MPIKVMLIEDDLIIAENLKENLIDLGYQVVGSADCFKEAVLLYEQSKPDICIVDIALKGSEKNGIETMHYLKAGEVMPIIYLTAFNDAALKEQAKLTYPSAYLLKPSSKAQLDITIDLALSNFRKRTKDHCRKEERIVCPLINSRGDFFIKAKDKYEKLNINDIICIKASGSYCHIYLEGKEYVISSSLKHILSQFSQSNLVRCHRSYAINIHFISAFDCQFFYVKNGMATQSIPYSSLYKSAIKPYLNKLKSE